MSSDATTDAATVDAEADAQAGAQRQADAMWADDRASQGLGIRISDVSPGRAVATMTVTSSMVNGHGSCHGGYLFLLADTAFAFACNTHGPPAVAAGADVAFLAPVQEGDLLVAEALLRIPDAGTADRLIRDKLGEADWKRHLGQSDSVLVNASTWGLMLTGHLVDLADEIGIGDRLAGGRARPAARHLHEQHQPKQDPDPDQQALDPGAGGFLVVHWATCSGRRRARMIVK